MRAFSTILATVIASVALAPVQAAPVKAVPVEPYFLGWPESNTVAGWHARREAVAPIFTFINLRRREPLELPGTIQFVPDLDRTIKARALDFPTEIPQHDNRLSGPAHNLPEHDVAPDTLGSWYPTFIGHCFGSCT